jgi:multiple sugar transport system permease protein
MRQRRGWLFVLPALTTLAGLVVVPAVSLVWLSVTDPGGRFVGGANFVAMTASPVTAGAVGHTVVFVGGSILLQLTVGTVVGILLNQPFRWCGLARTLTLIPWVVPGIVAATCWAWMLHTEFGIVNEALVGAGVLSRPLGWLVDPHLAMPTLIAVNVWKQFPFVAISVLAGLQAVPAELYEAARVDGATFWDEVRYVMLPGLRHVLIAVGLLLTIWGLNALTLVYVMTRGGPANRTLIVPLQIFRHAFESFRPNQAAALSAMYFLCALVLVVVYLRVFRVDEERS